MSILPILLQIDVPFCQCGSVIGILQKSSWFSWFPIPSWYWSNFCWFPAFHKIQLPVGIEYLLKWWCHSDSTSGFVIFLILCFIIFPVLHQLWRDMWNIIVYYLFPQWFDFCCIFGIFSVLTLSLSCSGLWVIFWTLVKLVG